MMEFLDTLFNYEYFGPILFAVIAILIVLFFIILFFGKKEEKERILEETRRLELASLNAFKEEQVNSIELEVKNEELKENKILDDNIEPVQITERNVIPQFEETKLEAEDIPLIPEINDEVGKEEMDGPVLTPVVETPLVTEVIKEEKNELPESDFKIEPSIPTNIPKYDFEELANSISKELEEIEKISNIKQEEKDIPKISIQEQQIEVTPIKEIQKFKPTPVFSSVFVPGKEEMHEIENKLEKEENNVVLQENKKVEENVGKVEIVKHEEQSIPKDDNKNIIDFSILKSNVVSNPETNKPKVELPKTVDLPKKNTEQIIETNLPNFEDIQGETYNISR